MSEPAGEFLADYEDGTANAYTSSTPGTGNTQQVLADAAIHGVYGDRFTFGGTAGGCTRYKTITERNEYWQRVYFNFREGYSQGSGLGIFTNLLAGGITRLYTVVENLGGVLTLLRLRWATDASSGYYTVSQPITLGEDHLVEIHWKAASAAGANDGVAELWYDGTLLCSVTNIDNDTHLVNRTQVGIAGPPIPTAGSVLDLDDHKVDVSYIGPYAGEITGSGSEVAPSAAEAGSGTVPIGPITGSGSESAPAASESGSGTVVNPITTLVIDHDAVAAFDDIPAYYRERIKARSDWMNLAGESHSTVLEYGLPLLAASHPEYAVMVKALGDPDMPTEGYLRTCRAWLDEYDHFVYGYGERNCFTNTAGIAQTKVFLAACHSRGYGLRVHAFGWCWDMTRGDPTVGKDPIYKCSFYGSSAGGPDGDKAWGLDAEDYAITANAVSMDSYLGAVEEYVAWCRENAPDTTVCFATGPVDGGAGTETGWQRHVKHEYERAYVQDHGGVLIDVADILSYDDAGNLRTSTWTDGDGVAHTMHIIALDNMLNLDGSSGADNPYHIGERGAVRLAKAVWVLLARLDGWDGEPVSPISGAGNEAAPAAREAGSGWSAPPVSGSGSETAPSARESGSGISGNLPPGLIDVTISEGPRLRVKVTEGGVIMDNASPLMLEDVEERGTKAIPISFSYESDGEEVAYIPKTASWSLYNVNEAIINSRESVPISSLTASITIVLSGLDLDASVNDELRRLVIKGTYDSALGNDLPFVKEVQFHIIKIAGQ